MVLFCASIVRSRTKGHGVFLRIKCPAHSSLFAFIYPMMSGSLNSLYNSWLYLLLHGPFSSTGPKIYLKILLSKILKSLSSNLDSGQVKTLHTQQNPHIQSNTQICVDLWNTTVGYGFHFKHNRRLRRHPPNDLPITFID
jgi:hypothetical protein